MDYALNWRHGIIRKIEDGQYVNSELLEGAEYINQVLKKVTSKEDKAYLKHLENIFKNEDAYGEALNEATSEKLYEIFYNHPIKLLENTSKTYQAYVDRKKARFSTWYEFFPRSASAVSYTHLTLPTICSV